MWTSCDLKRPLAHKVPRFNRPDFFLCGPLKRYKQTSLAPSTTSKKTLASRVKPFLQTSYIVYLPIWSTASRPVMLGRRGPPVSAPYAMGCSSQELSYACVPSTFDQHRWINTGFTAEGLGSRREDHTVLDKRIIY
jgi:hypothetical protein